MSGFLYHIKLRRIFKLRHIKFVVRAASFHELFWRAGFHDAAVVYYEDAVGILDGRETVGDNKACTVLKKGFDTLLDHDLGVGVDT